MKASFWITTLSVALMVLIHMPSTIECASKLPKWAQHEPTILAKIACSLSNIHQLKKRSESTGHNEPNTEQLLRILSVSL